MPFGDGTGPYGNGPYGFFHRGYCGHRDDGWYEMNRGRYARIPREHNWRGGFGPYAYVRYFPEYKEFSKEEQRKILEAELKEIEKEKEEIEKRIKELE